MKYFDFFNGDADGICALHQLRLAEPRPEAKLVTGVKRDIRLLQQLKNIRNAHVTVLDISLDSNRDSLNVLLENGCEIFYVDHHFSGDIPAEENLKAHINPDPEICTSLIVNQLLEGKYSQWAIVGAFGDNLHQAANRTAKTLKLSATSIAKLKELGELINYNGYGPAVPDLFFPPQDIYRSLLPYSDPLDFLEKSSIIPELRNGFHNDMQQAAAFKPVRESAVGRIFELPPEKWARRVAGVFSNLKAQEKPELAHALLTRNPDNTYRISVRAPLDNRKGADTLCRAFMTGGGRAGAAGINTLASEQLDLFFKTFEKVFQEIQTEGGGNSDS